jgi:type I restriction enzyme S subunit
MEMKKYKLGDVLEEFHSGNNIKAADIKDVGEYPVFGANGLRGYTDRYNCDGDVAIIGRQGAYCGNVKFFSGKAYYTEHAVIAKPKKGFDAKYLACKLPFYQLEKYQGQSAQPGLSVGTLSLIEVELPSYENQKEVALVLSALDSVPVRGHSKGLFEILVVLEFVVKHKSVVCGCW